MRDPDECHPRTLRTEELDCDCDLALQLKLNRCLWLARVVAVGFLGAQPA